MSRMGSLPVGAYSCSEMTITDELDGPTKPGTNPNAEPLREPTPKEAALIERTTQKVKEPKPPAIPPPVTTLPVAPVWDKRRKKRPPKT